MRVTDASVTANLLRALQNVRNQSSEALEQLADGKRVRHGSDDALAAALSLGVRAQLVRIEGFRRTAGTVRSDLVTLDTSLGEATDLLARARQLAISGGSDTAERQTLASEIDAIRDQLLVVANVRQNNRYLFSGSNTLTRPYEPDGSYQGNTSATAPEVDETLAVESTLPGSRAFSTVFDTLQQLSDALNADDGPAIQALEIQLDSETDNLNSVRGEIGTRLNAIESTVLRLDDRDFSLQTRLVELENIDLEVAATNLTSAETSGAALSAAAARVLGRSLFDFLA